MKLIRILTIAATVMALAACSKEEDASTDSFVKGQKVTLNVTADVSATKVTSELNETSGQVDFKWETGDIIKVTVGGQSSTFTLKSGAGTNHAMFEGEMPGSGDSFDVQYPYDAPDLTTQTYSSTEAIPHDKMKFAASGCSMSELSFSLSAQSAALKLNLWGTDKTISKIEVKNAGSLGKITLNMEGGVALPTTEAGAKAFFIAVPQGSYAFTAEIFDNAATPASICSFTPSAAQTFTDGQILNMPAKYVKSDVAKIGETKYETLAAAFEAVQDGQTIELLKDCSLTATATVDKNVTLNLGTYTLTNACSAYAFDLNTTGAGKTFKITGTDADNCGHIVSNGTSGHSGVACINASSSAVSFEMDYVKVHGATENDVYDAGNIIISDNSTGRTDKINLTDVSIKGNQDLISGSEGRAYASINVKGGVYSTARRGFRFCGAADSESVIDGVNLTTNDGVAVYAFSTTTLQNSTIDMTATGNSDAVSCSRKYNDNAVLTVKNNTIVAKGTATSAVAAESKGVINVESGTYSNQNSANPVIKVSASGGTINLNGGEIYGKAAVSSDDAFVIINGGTFKNDFTLYEGVKQYIRIAAESSSVFEGKVNGTTAVAIPAGTFKKAIANGDFTAGASISGGLFYEAAPYGSYIADGYMAVQNEGTPATWSIKNLPGADLGSMDKDDQDW